MTEHTKGPWEIVRYGDGDSLVIHSDDVNRVCFMATPGSHGDPAKIEADARLISAAPDLLEALQSIARQELPEDTSVDRQLDADFEGACEIMIKLARDAVTKATS